MSNCTVKKDSAFKPYKYIDRENSYIVDSTGLCAKYNGRFYALTTKDDIELTNYDFSRINHFQNGYASFYRYTDDGYVLNYGYLNKSGKEFTFKFYDFDSINWVISNPPSEIPDSSHILGFNDYINIKWTLPSILNHNLKAFIDETQIYTDLDKLDKICVGYGMLIGVGNYSEKYIVDNPKKWELFKQYTLFPIIKDQTLRKLTWNWIKPYYKDAFEKLNPFAQKTYKDCFQYLKNHVDSFEESEYRDFLLNNEKIFAKCNINGKPDNKRKLAAFIDRLILVHKLISPDDAKTWINSIYDDVFEW
jgi:hypothetical protein